jgi:hypothetical protein
MAQAGNASDHVDGREAQSDLREPSKVRASITPHGQGGAVIEVRYVGPLISYDPIWVRMGERRQGKDWVKTHDVMMSKADGEAFARIEMEEGEPIEGATFAFYTVIGRAGQEIWDNAGKPYGCYIFDAATGAITTR